MTESKKRKVKEAKRTLNKNQEVLFGNEFKAADRAGGKKGFHL